MLFLYLEQFLFTAGVFLGGLHPTITHVAIQISKDITLIVYRAIVSQLAYSRKVGTLKRIKGKIVENRRRKEKKNMQIFEHNPPRPNYK